MKTGTEGNNSRSQTESKEISEGLEYTYDLIFSGKDDLILNPGNYNLEDVEYTKVCARNTQEHIHSALGSIGTMMWMAGTGHGEGIGNEHEVMFGIGQLLETLSETLKAANGIEENCRFAIKKIKEGGAQ